MTKMENINQFAVGVFIVFSIIILTSGAFAYECWDGTNGAVYWWDLEEASGTLHSNCDTLDLSVSGSPTFQQAGAFSYGVLYDANSKYHISASSQVNDLTNGCAGLDGCSFAFWIKPRGGTTSQYIFTTGGQTLSSGLFAYLDGSEKLGVGIRNTTAYSEITGYQTTIGEYEHFAVTLNSTSLCLYANSTLSSCVANTTDTRSNVQQRVAIAGTTNLLGSYGSPGTIDEVAFFNYTLTQGEITNLVLYNNISGIVSAPAGSCSLPTISLTSPSDNDHTSTLSQNYQFNLTYYDCNALDNATLYVNGAYKTMNATALVNGTNTIAWSFDAGQGSYDWGVNVSNSTYTWDASNNDFTIVYDTTSPVVTISSPSALESFYYGDSNNLNVDFADEYIFNATCDVYNSTGSLIDSYVNDSGTPPNFLINDEFTSGLSVGNYTLNCTGQDSHTASENYIDAYKVGEKIKFRNIKTGKFYESSDVISPVEIKVFSSSFIKQFDRIKFSYHVELKNSLKNWDLTIPFTSDCPIYIIENSEYAGHMVTCDGWIDFEDASNEGWTISLSRKSDNAVDIRMTRTFGSSMKIMDIDPASGGLNTGFATTNFSVIPDSYLTATPTDFFKNEIGYVLLNYLNITDDTLITGATCQYTITDPYSNSVSGSAVEMPTFYQLNYTPSFTGTHTYSANCTKADWSDAFATGSFNVLSAPPDFSISLVVESGTEPTRTYCSGNNKVVEMNKTACLEGSCSDTSYSYAVTCPNGCYNGVCNEPQVNYIIYFIIGIFALIILMVALGLNSL